MMIARLLELIPWLNILVAKGHITEEEMLNRNEITELADLKELLEPFMLVQKSLEGQRYITIRLVPYLIDEIRKSIKKVVVKGNSVGVRTLAEEMMTNATKGFEVTTNEVSKLFLFHYF